MRPPRGSSTQSTPPEGAEKRSPGLAPGLFFALARLAWSRAPEYDPESHPTPDAEFDRGGHRAPLPPFEADHQQQHGPRVLPWSLHNADAPSAIPRTRPLPEGVKEESRSEVESWRPNPDGIIPLHGTGRQRGADPHVVAGAHVETDAEMRPWLSGERDILSELPLRQRAHESVIVFLPGERRHQWRHEG